MAVHLPVSKRLFSRAVSVLLAGALPLLATISVVFASPDSPAASPRAHEARVAADRFTVVQRSPNSVEIEVDLGGVEIERDREDGLSYIQLPGVASTGEPGTVALPELARAITLPADVADLRVEVIDLATRFEQAPKLGPVAPARIRDGRPAAPAVADPAYFTSRGPWPAKWAHVDAPALWRTRALTRLVVHPVRHHPARAVLEHATRLRLRLSWTRDDLRRPSATPLPSFERLKQRWTLDLSGHERTGAADVPSMLVIVGDRFVDSLGPWVEWKIKKGISVTVVPMCEVGDTPQDLFDTVRAHYDADPNLAYLALVGGHDDVPTNRVRAHQDDDGWGESDYLYSLLEGADTIGDILLARMPARSEDELRTILARSIAYERDVGHDEADADWVRHATGIGSSGKGNLGLEDFVRIDQMLTRLEAGGFVESDRFFEGQWHNEQELVAALDAGRSWLLFMGHGTGVNWAFDADVRFNFGLSNLLSIDNPGRWPFIADCSCSNGDFKNRDMSFAEAWLWHGTPQRPLGAAGMLSSTILASWDEPATMEEGMVAAYVEDGQQIWGESILGGLIFMETFHGKTAAVELSKKTFIGFGDPSLEMRSKTAEIVHLQHEATMPAGTHDFRVEVYDAHDEYAPSVRVSVSDPAAGRVLAVQSSDAAGVAVFSSLPFVAGRSYEVWATGFDIASRGGQVEVVGHADDAAVEAWVQLDASATTGQCSTSGGDTSTDAGTGGVSSTSGASSSDTGTDAGTGSTTGGSTGDGEASGVTGGSSGNAGDLTSGVDSGALPGEVEGGTTGEPDDTQGGCRLTANALDSKRPSSLGMGALLGWRPLRPLRR